MGPGSELRQIRRILGISQGDMGVELGGIKQATYSNYENGLRETPPDLLEKAKSLYRSRTGSDWVAPNISGNIRGTSKLTGDIRAKDEEDRGGGEAETLTAFQASKAAGQFIKEVKAAAPHFHESWDDEDEEEFRALVTFLLTSTGGKDLMPGLRALLIRKARMEAGQAKRPPASS